MKITTDTKKLWISHNDLLLSIELAGKDYQFTMDDLEYPLVQAAFHAGSNRYYLKGLVIGARAMIGIRQKLPFTVEIDYQELVIAGQRWQFGGPPPKKSFYRVFIDKGIKTDLVKGIVDGASNMRGPALRALRYQKEHAKL